MGNCVSSARAAVVQRSEKEDVIIISSRDDAAIITEPHAGDAGNKQVVNGPRPDCDRPEARERPRQAAATAPSKPPAVPPLLAMAAAAAADTHAPDADVDSPARATGRLIEKVRRWCCWWGWGFSQLMMNLRLVAIDVDRCRTTSHALFPHKQSPQVHSLQQELATLSYSPLLALPEAAELLGAHLECDFVG